MARKLKSQQFSFDNPPPPRPEVPTKPDEGLARIAEYKAPFDGETWRVSRMDLLRAEWPEIQDLVELHTRISRDARRWMVVRRLFGVGPLIPAHASDPDDLRTWGREELGAALGITQAQLQAELDAVRGLMMGAASAAAAPSTEPASPPPVFDASGAAQLPFADSTLLERYGFSPSKFDVIGRAHSENRLEQEWFCRRLEEWAKPLEDRMAGALARSALDNELHIRRAESEISRHPFGSKEYVAFLRIKGDLEQRYQEQLIKLNEVAPWMGAVSGKQGFVGAVSDLVKAHQEYYAEGTNALADGIFAATEIQVLMRRSLQVPEPQYRCGLVVHLNAAKAGLFDPQWRSKFKPAQLRKLDEAWRAASVAAGEAEVLPDLESEDPVKGEYEGLFVPEVKS